ncbi:MAG: FdhF/YdeP family oxidoreductase [Actinomycetes bacterium]
MTDRPHHPVPAAQPPAEPGAPRVTGRAVTAGGIPAVTSTVRHMLQATSPARSLKLLGTLNQPGGFDCPSCAWPDPAAGDRSFAEFCENGAKAVADAVQEGRVDPAFFARHSVAELADQRDRWLHAQGRLTHPMVLRPGATHYEPATWGEALGIVADHLGRLASPGEAVFYTSGRASNEAAFLYQAFVRAYGTNNLPDCSNMCHESSGTALTETIGIGKGTVTLTDVEEADVLVVLGQNPGTNHPRMLTALQRAVRRGAHVVAVNPLPEAGLVSVVNPRDFHDLRRGPKAVAGVPTRLARTFLPVRIGGDLALLTGVQKALVAREDAAPSSAVDRGFVADRTRGYDDLAAHLRTLDWDLLEAESGVPRASMEALADLLCTTRRIVWCWAMGLTQHEHAVATIQQVVNLALLRGAIGIPGAGLCPVRGHSNVQGDRTVGIWERPPAPFLDALDATLGITSPREHGLDTVDAIRAMRDGRVKVFVGLGGNFLSATPDTEVTAAALRSTDLTVQVSTTLNRSHLVTGRCAVILPCLARTDRDVGPDGRERIVSVENSMGIVTSSRGQVDPPSVHLRSEVDVVAGLARATLGPDHPVDWEGMAASYERIRAAIEATVPGFEDYEARLADPDGFALPNGPREGRFTTPDGLAVLTTAEVPVTEPPACDLPGGPLLLMTVRSHDQFNTQLYGDDDRYRGVQGGRRVVFCHADDLAAAALAGGDVVDLVGLHDDGVERVAEAFVTVPYDVPRGNCAAYFPETNVLVPLDRVARRSNTPVSKAVWIALRRRG